MRISIIVFFLLILGTSCDPPHLEESPYLPTKQSLANDVRNKAAVKLKIEKDLIPCGKAAQMMNEIKMLGLSFQYYKEIEIEEARELLISAGIVLLNEINSNELIRPYLFKHPFEISELDMRIFLLKNNSMQLESNKLHYVTMVNGVLKYIIRVTDTCYEEIYSETYEEAYKKLHERKSCFVYNLD